jgi:beta-glucanase (GH16 family)
MKPYYLLLAGILTACSGNDVNTPSTPPVDEYPCPAGEEYKLVWNDEFEGSSLNLTDWTVEVKPSGWVNDELQNYVNQVTPEGNRTITVSDGTLKITALKENDKVYSGRIYGKVKQGWQYAYVESRIKLPSGKGTWPAFWMLPVTDNLKWPYDGEIDIMEEVGADKDVVVSTIHCDAYNHVKGTQKSSNLSLPGAEGGFHVYGLEWTKNYIRTYVDGKPVLVFENDGTNNKSTWPFYTPFYVILNVAWGGGWGGYAGVDETALPITMEVDYVRVWQK